MALKGLKASLSLALLSIFSVGCMQPLGPSQRTHMPANSELGRQLGLNSAASQGSTPPYMNVNSGDLATHQFAKQPPSSGRFGAMRDMISSASNSITSSLPKMSVAATTPPSNKPSFAGPLKSSPNLHIKAAKLQESRGHVAAAVTQFQKAIELQPENPNSWIEFARLYDRAGDLHQASVAYQQAIQLAPNNPTPFNDLGLCFARHGKLQDAIATLNHAVRLQPQRKLYRNNLATVLVTAGLPDKAIEHLQQAFPPATANYNLAMMLIQQNNEADATRFLHQSIRLDPNFTPAQDMLAQLTPTDAPTHVAPPHVSPVHVAPPHVSPVHVSPVHVSPAHVSPAHISPAHISPAHISPAHIPPTNVSPANTSPVNLTVSPATPNPPVWRPSDRQNNNAQPDYPHANIPTLHTQPAVVQPTATQPTATQPPYAQQFPQHQTTPALNRFPTSTNNRPATHSTPNPPNNFVVPGTPLPGQRKQFINRGNTAPAANNSSRTFGQHQLQPVNQPNISFPYYNQ
jgi:Tfp pilus assembly protein PilF